MHSAYPHLKDGKLRDKRVHDLLRQPLYAGYICSEIYELDWHKGQHQPLIPMATYERIQERLKSMAYAPAHKNIGADFALRGFAVCADCGKPLRSSWPKGKYKRYAYYAVIGAYEDKIANLEKSKVRLLDSLSYQAQPRGTGRELLELSLMLLANPWKLWKSGNAELRRLVLRLGFSEGFAYHRIDGARTPKMTLPFNALRQIQYGCIEGGAAEEN